MGPLNARKALRWVSSGFMTTLTQAAVTSPGVLLAVGAVAVTGPVSLIAALRERGCRPVKALLRRLRRR